MTSVLPFALALGSTALAEVPVVRCPADPPVVRRLELRERWRIDAADPDAPLLGTIGPSQIVARDGRVYLLDGQLCHVLVYDDDGAYLDTIMREGEGPGELRNPGALVGCADGRLAAQHGYPSKLEFVDPDGTPRGRWRVDANAWIGRFRETSRGWVCVYTESKEGGEPGVFASIERIALHDGDGRRIGDFWSRPRESGPGVGGREREADEFGPSYTAVAADDDLVVYAAERDAYRLEWRGLDGEVVRAAVRDFPAHRRDEAELATLRYRSYSIIDGKVTFPDRELCDHDPVIGAIDPLPDGRLRVRTSLFEKELPPGMVCRYEVHAATGELLERVEIVDPTGAYDPDYDVIALLDDDRAVVLRNLRPASRVAHASGLHPEVREKLPPIPDDREDVTFAPIVYDLVPAGE